MKMSGKEAYERDLKRHPTYHDGSLRPAWNKLSDLARWTWDRDPTDRSSLSQSVDHKGWQ